MLHACPPTLFNVGAFHYQWLRNIPVDVDSLSRADAEGRLTYTNVLRGYFLLVYAEARESMVMDSTLPLPSLDFLSDWPFFHAMPANRRIHTPDHETPHGPKQLFDERWVDGPAGLTHFSACLAHCCGSVDGNVGLGGAEKIIVYRCIGHWCVAGTNGWFEGMDLVL